MSTPTTIRVFFGLPISNNLAHKLIDKLKQRAGDQFDEKSWVRDGNFHITLRFMGTTEKHYVDTLSNMIKSALSEYSPLDISIYKVDYFPRNSEKLIAAYIEKTPELQSLFETLEEFAISLGYKPDAHHFTPHITLYRRKNASQVTLEQPIMEESINLSIDQFHLYHSQPGDEGVIYMPLETFKFGE